MTDPDHTPYRATHSILPPDAEDELEDEMKTFMSGRDLNLYRMMEYQLGWLDDRTGPEESPRQRRRHGSLTLAATHALQGDYSLGLKYAVSVELIHNFSIIHGDLQDSNTERDGKPSLWWKWGPSQAINTGDGMHALARISLFSLQDHGEPIDRISDALEITDDATLKMCEGEYLDVQYQEGVSLRVDDYIDMVERRAGSLYGAAAELASIFTTAHETRQLQATSMRNLGIGIGLTAQLVKDFNSFFAQGTRDPIDQGRIIAKKKSLPIAYLFDKVKDPTLLRRAGELYMQRVIDPSKVEELVEIAESAGARDFTLDQAQKAIRKIENAIDEARLQPETANAMLELAKDLSNLDTLPER